MFSIPHAHPTLSARIAAPALAIAVILLSASAGAQTDPKFQFVKPEAPPATVAAPTVEWKAQVKGGFTMTSGNSQATNGTLSGNASRKSGGNKLALDASIAYGTSNVLRPNDLNANGVIDNEAELTRESTETTNNWMVKGRYDRFLTPNNATYVSAQAAADRVAGKKFQGGGQAGYSRQLLKNDVHTAVAELGYDLSYEAYVAVPVGAPDAVSIHSARVFAGETVKVSSDTGVFANVEALFNLNEENTLDASDTTGQTRGVKAFKDTRVIGKVGITTTFWKNVSFGFNFTIKYDNNPATLPALKGFRYASTAMMDAADFQPFAEKLDTQAEATLIFTFL